MPSHVCPSRSRFPELLSQSSGSSSAVPLLAILELNSSCLLWARFVVSQIFGFLSVLLATSSGLCSAVFLSTQVSMQASTPCPPNKIACQFLPLPPLLSSPSEPCKVRNTLFNLVFTLHFCCLYFIDQLIGTVRVSPPSRGLNTLWREYSLAYGLCSVSPEFSLIESAEDIFVD